MSIIITLLADPRTLPAALALAAALAAWLRADTARIDAKNALRRTGGRRADPTPTPPPGTPERRKS
jgi:hypothetical protein